MSYHCPRRVDAALIAGNGVIMSKLEGKTAVITGATAGMGLATAKLFVAEGAHVYITGRRREPLDAAVADIGDGVTGIQGDAADPAHLDELFETVKTNHGRLDILFASAGIGSLAEPLRAVTADTFDQVFHVNVLGTLLAAQRAVALMTDGGSIILNGSLAAAKGLPGATVYSASKAALRSFARTWTAEFKDQGIRVNLIHPGSVDTAALDAIPPEMRDQIKAMIPIGRFGRVEEIAQTALFLASNDSSFINGVELFVDGGAGQV